MKKVILLKEKDIENGLQWDDYIDWCSLFNRSQLYNASKYCDYCTKEELDNYFLKNKHGSLRPK